MACLVGKREAGRRNCAPLANKGTLNRLELSRPEPTRYHKVSHDREAIEDMLVTLFTQAHNKAPKEGQIDCVRAVLSSILEE